MMRILTLALALAAGPVWAAGPALSISGATTDGGASFPFSANTPCGVSGQATFYVTFTDPDGIAYAAVDLQSAAVRPAVSNQARTWLWIPSYARPSRGYQWRYEEPAATRTSHTIPISIDFQPNAGRIPAAVMAKDGKGALTIRRFSLTPAACR